MFDTFVCFFGSRSLHLGAHFSLTLLLRRRLSVSHTGPLDEFYELSDSRNESPPNDRRFFCLNGISISIVRTYWRCLPVPPPGPHRGRHSAEERQARRLTHHALKRNEMQRRTPTPTKKKDKIDAPLLCKVRTLYLLYILRLTSDKFYPCLVSLVAPAVSLSCISLLSRLFLSAVSSPSKHPKSHP